MCTSLSAAFISADMQSACLYTEVAASSYAFIYTLEVLGVLPKLISEEIHQGSAGKTTAEQRSIERAACTSEETMLVELLSLSCAISHLSQA